MTVLSEGRHQHPSAVPVPLSMSMSMPTPVPSSVPVPSRYEGLALGAFSTENKAAGGE